MAAPRNPFEFPAMLQGLAADVETLRLRLRAQMHSDSCKGGDDSSRCCIAAKGGVDPKLPRMLAEVVGAAKALGGEIRMWDGHTRTNLDQMTPARKATIIMRFIQDQPLSGRRDIYAVLARNEADRPDGLQLTVVDKFTSGAAVE